MFSISACGEKQKDAYKERLRSDLLIASQMALLFAACG
jgi:hypothetical protein